MKVLMTLTALLCAYTIDCQVEVVNLYNFETEATSAQFLHFGSNMEGKMTSPVDNPLPTSLNMSSKVLTIVKGSDAEVWGGAFLNPDFEQPLDATFVRQICMKVMFVLPGNIAMKLEADPFDDPENWINVVDVPVAQEWVDICFDLDKPSIEGNKSYPYGKLYDRLVFYPDFGKAGNGQDGSIYFIDDITFHYDWDGVRKNVSFGIDMNTYNKDYDRVFVAGNFNGWSGGAFELQDDGTGYYSGSMVMASGEIEYKYTVDHWTDQEYFHKYGECTATTLMSDGAAYVNRYAAIFRDTELSGMAWGSCYPEGEGVDITWSVNMAQEEVAPEGVFLAGGCCFSQGEFRMWDNYDDIYSLTIERRNGFSGHYTFTNGTCWPGWSCKEDLQADICGDPSSYHDRYLDPVLQSTTMSHCFGQCGTDGYCEPEQAPSLITFVIDMGSLDVDDEGVMISGTFSGWSDMVMESGGDGMYEISLWLMPGTHQWKFKNGPWVWESFAVDSGCTMSTDAGSGGYYVNRFLELDEGTGDLRLDPVCFSECDSCESLVSSIDETDQVASAYEVYPTFSDREFNVLFTDYADRKINLFSADGILVKEVDARNELEVNLDVSYLESGLYFIQVLTESGMSATKVMVTR